MAKENAKENAKVELAPEISGFIVEDLITEGYEKGYRYGTILEYHSDGNHIQGNEIHFETFGERHLLVIYEDDNYDNGGSFDTIWEENDGWTEIVGHIHDFEEDTTEEEQPLTDGDTTQKERPLTEEVIDDELPIKTGPITDELLAERIREQLKNSKETRTLVLEINVASKHIDFKLGAEEFTKAEVVGLVETFKVKYLSDIS